MILQGKGCNSHRIHPSPQNAINISNATPNLEQQSTKCCSGDGAKTQQTKLVFPKRFTEHISKWVPNGWDKSSLFYVFSHPGALWDMGPTQLDFPASGSQVAWVLWGFAVRDSMFCQ
jgi:hypothetical protein